MGGQNRLTYVATQVNKLSDITAKEMITYVKSVDGTNTTTEDELFNVDDFEDNSRIGHEKLLSKILIPPDIVIDDNTSIARAVITLKPGIWVINANVHLKSNAPANDITKLIISLSPKVAELNRNICIQRTSVNPIYTLNQDDELSENISTTVKITEITPIHLIISCVSTQPMVTTPFCRFNARSIE